MFRLMAVLLATLCGGLSTGTQQDNPTDATKKMETGILAGETDQILAAGKTNDRRFVRVLRTARPKKNHLDYEITAHAAAVQMALAKLGERPELQEILCELNFGTPEIQYSAVNNKLTYIGGWFSINALVDLMRNESPRRPLLKAARTDAAYGSPRFEALFVLPKIVPDPPSLPLPPASESAPETNRLREAWLQWIEQNAGSLKNLQPTETDLPLSVRVCKLSLEKDRAYDRSHLQEGGAENR